MRTRGLLMWGLAMGYVFAGGCGDEPPEPSITVLSPNGGETWYVGETHDITWEAVSISGEVLIRYSRVEDTFLIVETIATVPAADATYSWRIPHYLSTTPSTVYVSHEASGVSDESDAPFDIVRPPVKVLSPNGGEALAVGSVCAINWSIGDITGDVEVHYSTDSGQGYPNLIATVPASDLIYLWTVPADESTQCRIRVQEPGGLGETDESDADFTITQGTGGWSPMSSAGAPPGSGAAFWTGSEMVAWASFGGGTYDPGLDAWTPINETDAPVGREYWSAVWTGSKLILWGGEDGATTVNTGAVYDLAGDSWTPTGTSGELPCPRLLHSAVWTSAEMIVWGGEDENYEVVDSGAMYDPASGSWTAMASSGAPAGRLYHSAVWTGTEMIVWGGTNLPYYIPGQGWSYEFRESGGRYDPSTDTWTGVTTSGAPSPRAFHAAVWTGSKMIVWGGHDADGLCNTGARYDPAADSWTPTTTSGAPTARLHPAAAWTGSKMIVWGGVDSLDEERSTNGDTNSGGIYDPASDSWTPMDASGAPSPRYASEAVWTGTKMILQGGWHNPDETTLVNYGDGAIYTP